MTGPIGMRFRYVPAGKFQIGSPDTETDRDYDEALHQVELTRAFWIGETEVTQGQWRQLVEAKPSYFKDCDDCPVERVSWFEAVIFANLLSERADLAPCYATEGCRGTFGGGCEAGTQYCVSDYSCESVALPEPGCNGFRLPTEAEWEYAARAGTTTPFSSGANLTTEQANYNGGHPYADHAKGEYRRKTVAVRSFEPNPWGLYEIHGNVWEWVWDRSGGAYPGGPVVDPTGPETGSARVLRGGSWFSYARYCRSADRYGIASGYRSAFIGFRLVRTSD